jgi:hypothetical protein
VLRITTTAVKMAAPDPNILDVPLYIRGDHNIDRTLHWCSSLKEPVKDNIKLVYMHMRLIVKTL